MSRISPRRGAVDDEASWLYGSSAPRFVTSENWAIGQSDVSPLSTKRATAITRQIAGRTIRVQRNLLRVGRNYSLSVYPNAALVVAGSTTAKAAAAPTATAISITASAGRASPT